MLVVNLFAGPGCGKTTLAHLVTGRLKMAAAPLVVEYVGEYAKRLVFEERYAAMANQILILGRQFQELSNLHGKADIVVTDGPILHGLIYGRILEYPQSFYDNALWCHRQFPTLNVFVERPTTKEYETVGRIQSFEESLRIDQEIRDMLAEVGEPIDMVARPDEASAAALARLALARAAEPKPTEPTWFDRESKAGERRDAA
jgi:hypothetical protein